jgi:hypothetical protein
MPDFQVFTRSLVIPERGPVTSYVVVCASNQFAFLPPPGWLISPDAKERTITLKSRDYSSSLSLKIVPAVQSPSTELKADDLRQLIRDRYPGVRIVREFACHTASGDGLAFDVEQVVQSKRVISRRLAFVPVPGGRVEFNLTCSPDKLASLHTTFGNLLTSFRVQPAPKEK